MTIQIPHPSFRSKLRWLGEPLFRFNMGSLYAPLDPRLLSATLGSKMAQ